jgi:hypothetical protein
MPRHLIGKYKLISNMDEIPVSAYPLRVSEKFDGMFALWDGGFSRGEPKSFMPWANRWKDKGDPICSGLWSKDGNVIPAPDWFLDALPAGRGLYLELWAGNGAFQSVISTCKKKKPVDSEWETIVGKVFNDNVPLRQVLGKGWIKYQKTSVWIDETPPFAPMPEEPFVSHVPFIQNIPVFIAAEPNDLSVRLQKLPAGAEGLVCTSLNEPFTLSEYTNGWKIKDCMEADGEVVGYYPGEKRLLGQLGSLKVRFGGVYFSLGGGLDDRDRKLSHSCHDAPEGVILPPFYRSNKFPLGTIVQFSYRKLSDSGIPCEARFERIKE